MIIRFILGIVMLVSMSIGQLEAAKSSNHVDYYSEVTVTIPWGDAPGQLSTLWNADPDSPEWHGLIDPPGPWAVSDQGELVIADYDGTTARIMKFTSDGQMIAHVNLSSVGLLRPFHLAINPSGQILVENRVHQQDMDNYVDSLYLFDPSLTLMSSTAIPVTGNLMVLGLYPSQDDDFWILYRNTQSEYSSSDAIYELGIVRSSPDGMLDSMETLYSGQDADPGSQQAGFITPSGDPISRVTDCYGYTFSGVREIPDVTMGRFSPEGNLVYTHDLPFIPGWRWYPSFTFNYYITWSGDFYTLHATDEGAVLTKYTLQVE